MRRVLALDLRTRGYTFRAIAADLDVSVGQAYADVEASLSELADLEHTKAIDVRRLYLERIEALIKGHYVSATDRVEALDKDGTKVTLSPDDKSARVILSALERGAKLLGIDAPEKHEVSAGSDVELYLRAKYGIGLEAEAEK